jgi:hypothetical protein
MKLFDLGKSVSKAYSFDYTDILKVARDAVIVGTAAALTVAIENVGRMNFGTVTPILLPIISIALNAAMRYIKPNNN